MNREINKSKIEKAVERQAIEKKIKLSPILLYHYLSIKDDLSYEAKEGSF